MEGKNELKILENDMVPVYETSTGEKVVYGSELHEALGIKTPYRIWVARRFSDCEATESEEYEPVQICTPSGQSKTEHIIKLDLAKEMSMLERNEKGKLVRRYFIQVEKKYKTAQINQNEKIIKALDDLSERVSTLEQKRAKKPALPDSLIVHEIDTESRIRKFDRLSGSIAELLGVTKPRFLHMVYRVMDKKLDLPLDERKKEYNESNPSTMDMSTLRVICSSNDLYCMALNICEDTFKYICNN